MQLIKKGIINSSLLLNKSVFVLKRSVSVPVSTPGKTPKRRGRPTRAEAEQRARELEVSVKFKILV